MPLVIVVSSHVAGSRVGSGVAPFALAPMGIDPVIVPTTLLGRHPGWGAPGGGAVGADTVAGMLSGVEANGLFSLCDVFLTGYFASAEQVEVAADAIDRLRAAPRGQAHDAAPARPVVVVDPIMGDEGVGLYVKPAVAEALTRLLVPRADVIAPNRWELARLAQAPLEALADDRSILAAARDLFPAALVTSVPAGEDIGCMYADADAAWLASGPHLGGAIPRGTGDLLTALFCGGLARSEAPEINLARSAGAVEEVIRRALTWSSTELPLANCQDVLGRALPLTPARRLA